MKRTRVSIMLTVLQNLKRAGFSHIVEFHFDCIVPITLEIYFYNCSVRLHSTHARTNECDKNSSALQKQ